jgi:uncharacterized protein (TIGR03437 family)
MGAASAIALSQFPDRLLAGQEPENNRHLRVSPIDRAPDLVRRALSSKIMGFPTVQPIFGGSFLPGGTQTQLISANGFDSLNTQVQTLAASGWVLASLTAIRNMNATWYYAVLEQGSGNYTLLRTSDQNVFQQAFTANQSGYRLVDFTITWEQGQLYYTGYWIAVASQANQMLVWTLDSWGTLSGEGMRLTRVQPFPQMDVTAYCALYEPGTEGYVLWFAGVEQFPIDTTGKWAGSSLVGLGYDIVNGQVVGCWQDNVKPYQFVWNQDWNTLQATAQTMAANGLILRAVSAYPSAPDWDDYFATYLAPLVMGYSYAVGQNGQIVAEGYGFARGPNETQNPNVAFTPNTRINFASVSKVIAGIALEVMIQQYPTITLDTQFWPLIASMVPNPDPSVKVVTLRELANMTSGLALNQGPYYSNLWTYLNSYLKQPLVGTPGVTYLYNNDNYTILEGVIEQVTGQDFVTWVSQNVLVPAGVNTSILNTTPDPQATSTLGYSGPNDPLPGQYFSAIDFVATGGYFSTPTEMLKVLLALRNTSVLPASTISEMLNDEIGAWVPFAGNYGTYYQKGGLAINGHTPPQALATCVVRLGEGYDIAMVANNREDDLVTICAGAFDSRGLLTTDLPPAIATVIGAATYLPKAAPGAYCAIMGSGFTDQAANDWDSSITGTALPTSVGGISVNVNGKSTYVEYISATQVNFLLPASTTVGTANVELVTPTGVMSTTLEIDAVAPGPFCYTLHGVLYPMAVFATGSGVVYVALNGALPGYNCRPAAAGDVIELYATGCGPTNPVAPDGVVLTTVYPAANLAAFQVTIAGKAASVLFAGLVGAGLWQINVQIPAGLPGGDQPLVLSVNNVASQPNVMLTVQGG